MVTTAKKRKSTGAKKRCIGKPTGLIQERVQAVGPEHFGILAVDCAKRRSKWMLCNFYGQVIVEPTAVEHTNGALQLMTQRAADAFALIRRINLPKQFEFEDQNMYHPIVRAVVIVFVIQVGGVAAEEHPIDHAKTTLRSTNLPPKIAQRAEFRLAEFPPGFDWSEQARVSKLFAELGSDSRENRMDDSFKLLTDDKYAITLIYDDYFARNYSVSELVRMYIIHRLTSLYSHYVPLDVTGKRVNIEIAFGDLREWKEQRKEMSLVELQIDLAKFAIAKLDSDDDIDADLRANARRKMLAAIDKAQKTKMALYQPWRLNGLKPATEDDANRFRRLLESCDEKECINQDHGIRLMLSRKSASLMLTPSNVTTIPVSTP